MIFPPQMSGQSAPAPTRGPSVGGDEDEGEGEEEGGGASAPVSLADLMPKVINIITRNHNHSAQIVYIRGPAGSSYMSV